MRMVVSRNTPEADFFGLDNIPQWKGGAPPELVSTQGQMQQETKRISSRRFIKQRLAVLNSIVTFTGQAGRICENLMIGSEKQMA